MIALIWPSLAISVKRRHDRNKSGWWMLLWMVLSAIPYVGILASLWCLVESGFLADGTQGPNQFRPRPRAFGGDLVAEAFYLRGVGRAATSRHGRCAGELSKSSPLPAAIL